MFLVEPLVVHHTIPTWYWQKVNLQHCVTNDRNSIWCLWNSQHHVSILLNKGPCIAFSFMYEGSLIYTAVVYASTRYTNRRELWSDLTKLLKDFPGPCMFVGDYNSILGAHERVGGRIPLHVACYEFREWSNMHALIHIETNGAQFTWINRREGGAFMAQRLDRAICNEEWIDYWSIFSCNTLVKCYSDHFPLLLTLHKKKPCHNHTQIQIF